MSKHTRMILLYVFAMYAGMMAANDGAQAQDMAWPVATCTSISDDYGPRDGTTHSGIDISCAGNHDVLAAADGEVIAETTDNTQCTYSNGHCYGCVNERGNSLTIKHDNGWHTVSMHLEKKYVSTGDRVKCGQPIGKMGTTGCSTGQHLHFTTYETSYSKHDSPWNHVEKGNMTCPSSGWIAGLDLVTTYDPQNTDIDGDGVAEICIRGNAGIYCTFPKTDITAKSVIFDKLTDKDGWDDSSNYATIRFADVNGDGKADVCARSDTKLSCWISNGSGFETEWGSVPMADADGYKAPQYYATIKFADINGDAKDDFCARFKDGFKCYLSSENGFSETSVDLKAMSDADGWDDASRYATIRMADINGDGMADACGLSKSGWQCWPSKGDSFGEPIQGPAWSDDTWSEAMYFATIRMPDINGDHKADVCARDAKGIVCHLSTGEGWGEAIRGPELSDEKGWGKPEYYMTLQFGDLNKDGKDDLCARGADEFICYLSDGESFKRDEKYVLTEFSNAKGGNAPGVYRTIHLGDVNGDGIMDVCGRNPSKAVCFVYGGDTPKRLEGPNLNDSYGWDENPYGSTFRFGGPKPKDCSFVEEICDEKDNNCNGETDEGGICCVPEVCDQKDNDCDGEVDEDNVCCEPSDEICDGKDNDCDGQIDEDDVCCVPEICDQKDNDCDGEIDEDNVCCEPSEEICDQKDNDCDGEVDEDDVCKKPEEEKPDKPDKPDKPGTPDTPDKPDTPDTPDESADNTPASSAEGCSSQPQGTSSHPMPWLLGFGGLLGMIAYRRRRA